VADQNVLLNTITNSHNFNFANIVLPSVRSEEAVVHWWFSFEHHSPPGAVGTMFSKCTIGSLGLLLFIRTTPKLTFISWKATLDANALLTLFFYTLDKPSRVHSLLKQPLPVRLMYNTPGRKQGHHCQLTPCLQ
jgi:hypothetical protein